MTIISPERDSQQTHSERVSNTEKQVSHQLEHHSYSQVYKELNDLRTYDQQHGESFHKDLTDINTKLHQDFQRDHFPSLTIEENGKGGFKVKQDHETPPPPHSTPAAPETGNGTAGGGTGSEVSSPGPTPVGGDGRQLGNGAVSTAPEATAGNVGALTPAQGQAPENAKAIFDFLVQHGLSKAAAAGIVGNIAQESGGNPESVGSGGNGLIGWTPPLAGAVTGNPQRDLAFQLNALMKYIAQNGSVADINAHASSPQEAAIYFQNQYERPAPATENEAHRVAAAQATYGLYG